jgi:hypothetical protein
LVAPRKRGSIVCSFEAATMRNFLHALAVTAFAAFSPAGFAAPNSSANQVDVELVIAVDISYSMDSDEQALQRNGYIDAILSQDFLNAVRKGPTGRIAVAYVEWAGSNDQRLIVPWQVIDGPESADAFVHVLHNNPPRRASRTSISGALKYSAELFEQSPYRGLRRVIDVSGDGTNNQGLLVAPTRDEVVAKGITINGLPIMLKEATPGFLDIPNLDEYYRDCVIGGPGAFMVPARGREQFVEAIRRKLLFEVAGLMPAENWRPRLAADPTVSCTLGERMWGERWGTDH